MMIEFLKQILQDKDGSYSLREVAILLLLLAMLISWVAQQFFEIAVPEFIFYSFTSLVTAGCFGYSFERKTPFPNNQNAEQQ
jgi:hypothetical protein